MAAPDELLYEYAVVRYVPCIEREEFINIGLIMMSKRRRWLRGEIRLDRQRLLAFDRCADLQFLRNQASVFERKDVPSADIPVEERYRWLAAVKSAILQVSPSHPGCLVGEVSDTVSVEELLDAEFNRLLACLVL